MLLLRGVVLSVRRVSWQGLVLIDETEYTVVAPAAAAVELVLKQEAIDIDDL